MSMIHQAVEIEIGGKRRFIYAGFLSQRRLRHDVNRSWEEFWFRDLYKATANDKGELQSFEINQDLLLSGLWATLHDRDPASANKLIHCNQSKEEIAALLDEWHAQGNYYAQQLALVALIADAGRLVGIVPPKQAESAESKTDGDGDSPRNPQQAIEANAAV